MRCTACAEAESENTVEELRKGSQQGGQGRVWHNKGWSRQDKKSGRLALFQSPLCYGLTRMLTTERMPPSGCTTGSLAAS